jgi:hypothetical protein
VAKRRTPEQAKAAFLAVVAAKGARLGVDHDAAIAAERAVITR